MKYTEGAFRNWGYELALAEFGDQVYTWAEWDRTKNEKGKRRLTLSKQPPCVRASCWSKM